MGMDQHQQEMAEAELVQYRSLARKVLHLQGTGSGPAAEEEAVQPAGAVAVGLPVVPAERQPQLHSPLRSEPR